MAPPLRGEEQQLHSAVGAAASHGLDFVRAGDRHDKLKNLVAVLRGKLFAVHKQRDAGLVGVDLDFGLALRAVDVAASAEMHKPHGQYTSISPI